MLKKIMNGIMITLAAIAIIAMIAIAGFVGFVKIGEQAGFVRTEVKITGVDGTVIYDSDEAEDAELTALND